MARSVSHGAVIEHISRLAHCAENTRGVPADIASQAAEATVAALCVPGHHRGELLERAERYFWTVVRNKLVRGRHESPATSWFILAAVVADLEKAGRDRADVWDELQRAWSDKVPRDVLEEYRLKLCA